MAAPATRPAAGLWVMVTMMAAVMTSAFTLMSFAVKIQLARK